ncbi:FAD/NAD(P)-binding domain-containing protein [Peniophora sp. CONT]|nr:FAD/NAD(P)-binding domain-containing protein [Peniophora sp. CONT]
MRASVALWTTIACVAIARAAPGSDPLLQQYDAENPQKPFIQPSSERGKRILIIGAGTAGVAALKALLVDLPEESRHDWEVTVFEQRSGAGGVWLADNVTHPEPPELPDTPLYPDLVTNTPHPIMTIPLFPFRPETPLFPSHRAVRQYHDDILAHFNLTSHVRFNTRVVETRWQDDHWLVYSEDGDNTTQRSEFDNLIVANGHFHYPLEPVFAGRSEWENAAPSRTIFHSIYFRNASSFAGKNVVVVGGSASGQDVAKHAVPYANSTTIAVKDVPYRDRYTPLDIPGVVQKPALSHFTADAVVFVDGTQLTGIDIVVLATGYEERVPFLTQGGVLSVDKHRDPAKQGLDLSTNLRYIRPVWRHIFALDPALPPTALAFVGLPIFVNNGPNSFSAGLFIAHVLANPSLLPTREELLQELRDREDASRAAGLDPEYVGHRLIALPGEEEPAGLAYSDTLIRYLQERGLAGLSGIPPLGQNYTEPWRRRATQNGFTLRRAWQRIRDAGDEAKWVKGVSTIEQWDELIGRLLEWEREQDGSADELPSAESYYFEH